MLLPFTRTWTSFQKRLIVGAAAFRLIASGAFIYCYETYYRGLDDSALFGTWEERRPGEGLLSETDTGEIKEDPLTIYYRLNPDHTFEFVGDLADEQSAFMRGTWHAGGDVVYLNLRWEDALQRKLIFWRIEELSSDKLRIRYNPGARLHTFNRVRLASDQ